MFCLRNAEKSRPRRIQGGREAGVGPKGKVHGHRFWREQAEKVRLGWDLVREAPRDWQVYKLSSSRTSPEDCNWFSQRRGRNELPGVIDAERFSGKHQDWLWRKQKGTTDRAHRFWWRFPQDSDLLGPSQHHDGRNPHTCERCFPAIPKDSDRQPTQEEW